MKNKVNFIFVTILTLAITFPLGPIFSRNLKEFGQSLLIALGGPIVFIYGAIRSLITYGGAPDINVGDMYDIGEYDNSVMGVGFYIQDALRDIIFGGSK